MHLLSWVDNRTLFAAQAVLLAVFTVMLLGLRSFYPQIPGIASVTAGFVSGAFATWLLTAEGRIPWFVSVVCGGAFLFTSSLFLYRGVLRFCRAESTRSKAGVPLSPDKPFSDIPDLRPLLYVITVAALALLIFFTEYSLRPFACIVTITASLAIFRFLMAWTLFRASTGRRHILAFAASMALFGAVSTVHAVTAFQLSSAVDIMRDTSYGTVNLLLSMAFFCVQGIFYLLMFAGHVAETMEDQAHLDYVCATFNRRGIEDALTAEIARTRRGGLSFAALLLDLDHFKSINDRFGHAAGDEALRKVTRCINATIRLYDQVGRFGGDEFLILLPQTSGENALLIADRIRLAVASDPTMPGGATLTLSIGVATGAHPEVVADILARADAALYGAKAAGRNCVHLHVASTCSLPGRRPTAFAGLEDVVQEFSPANALTGGA